jgi:MDM10-complementing protein 1, transmembrane domain
MCVIPLFTITSPADVALRRIDNGFMITRYLYRPSELVETGLVWGPLVVHVLSGFILRARRILMDRSLYGEGIIAWHQRQTRVNRAQGLSWPRIRALPTLGYSVVAATGLATFLFVGLHAYTVRYLPYKYGGDGETSVTIVSRLLQKYPYVGYTLYAGLVSFGTFHVISGWGRWLRLTTTPRGRRIKNYLVLGTISTLLVSLVRVRQLPILSEAIKREYDSLYQYLWSGF